MLYASNLHAHLHAQGFGRLRVEVRGDYILVFYKRAPRGVRRAIDEYDAGLLEKPVLPVRLKKAKW